MGKKIENRFMDKEYYMSIFNCLLMYDDNENYSEFCGKNMFALINMTTQTIFEVSENKEYLSVGDFDSYISEKDKMYILDIDRDILISV